LVITNPNDEDTIHFQTFGPSGVIPGALGVVMTTTIDFNCQFQFMAVEVGDEAANDMLATKLEPQETPISENFPGLTFCFRELTSQLSRALNFCLATPIPPTSHAGTLRTTCQSVIKL